jgi:uncharacterized DUF497 family protein
MRGLPGAAGGGRGGAWKSHRRAAAGSLAREDKCLYTIRVRFEWDPRKADANFLAHGIGFAEAVTVLEDAFALTREDPDAVGEQRFVTLGLSDQANLLVVVYAYREPDIVRMLSAWRANKRQREVYEKGRG